MHAKINVAFSQQLLVQKRPVLYQNGAKIDMFLGYFNMSSENGSKGLKTGGLGRSVGAPSDRESPTVRGRVGRSALYELEGKNSKFRRIPVFVRSFRTYLCVFSTLLSKL